MSSRTLTGTIRRLGLEGGLWALRLDDGTMVELLDPPAELLVDGLRAEVTGDRDGADVSIGMVGDTLRVRSFRRI